MAHGVKLVIGVIFVKLLAFDLIAFRETTTINIVGLELKE